MCDDTCHFAERAGAAINLSLSPVAVGMIPASSSRPTASTALSRLGFLRASPHLCSGRLLLSDEVATPRAKILRGVGFLQKRQLNLLSFEAVTIESGEFGS